MLAARHVNDEYFSIFIPLKCPLLLFVLLNIVIAFTE